MECMEFRFLIKSYLDNELDEKNLRRMMEHIDECPECKGELKLQYLVKEGLYRLGNGGNLDLQKDFELDILASKNKVRALGILNRISSIGFAVAMVIVLFTLIFGII